MQEYREEMTNIRHKIQMKFRTTFPKSSGLAIMVFGALCADGLCAMGSLREVKWLQVQISVPTR
jgi:hypothetical protein